MWQYVIFLQDWPWPCSTAGKSLTLRSGNCKCHNLRPAFQWQFFLYIGAMYVNGTRAETQVTCSLLGGAAFAYHWRRLYFKHHKLTR